METEQEKYVDPESLCRHCGRCCHRKEIINGKIVFTKDVCPNLLKDEHGKISCKIYDNRLGKLVEIGGKYVKCILAEEAYQQGLLPADCPYVYFYQKGMDKNLRNFLMFQEICETQNWDGIIPSPKKNCNHCYGRGYTGKDIITQTYVKCQCLA